MKNLNSIMNFVRLSASRTNLSDISQNGKCNKIRSSSWSTNDYDEGETASQKSNSENRELLVQLDAAREALFNHQRKTQDVMEVIEEEMEGLKNKLSEVVIRENDAQLKVKSLEMALEEMQSEKHLIQRTTSQSLDELLKAECQKQNDLQELVSRLNKELDSKEEDNIRLRMTIIKVQEDLTKENHLKDACIEQRDNEISLHKLELAELRMQNEVKNLRDSKGTLEESTEESQMASEELSTLSALKKKIEQQEAELTRLREENKVFKENILRDHARELPMENGIYTTVSVDEQPEQLSNLLHKEVVENQEDVPVSLVHNGSSDGADTSKTSYMDESEKEEAIYRLQLRLHETEDSCRKAESRADHMTYLLNQKLIELNKLQLTLSGQTKEMIQLEKAYYQLKCHLSKGYRSSATSSRNSSRLDLSTT